MNLAMISEHASPLAILGGVDAGGQNVHVAELSSALVRAGHRVVVYTRREDARTPSRTTGPGGATVVQIDAGPAVVLPKDELAPLMPEFGARLAREFANDRPDVAHAHFWMSGVATLLAARGADVPVVQTFHALGAEKRRMQGAADSSPSSRLAEELRIVREADRVVATSSSEIFELCRLGADPRKLKIVPCGVDLAAFDAHAGMIDLPRRRRHRVATLSRLVERKGVDDVIEALAWIDDAELVIAGGPPRAELGDCVEAQRLLRSAREHGVTDRVVLLGRVDRADVPRFLRSADVVACAAWYEPFGIVPLEAMAAGVPVVATAVGGQKDTVIDRFTGSHVAPNDPRALAGAIAELLEDPALRSRLGAAGRMRVQQRFTWDRVAAETLKVYRALAVSTEAMRTTA